MTGETSLETASIGILHAIGGSYDSSLMAGANGDMACNEMSAFDPMFFLHMANIDRIFWEWQLKNNPNDPGSTLKIDTRNKQDRGIKTKYGQGPAPNQNGDEEIDNNSKLFPFKDPITPQEIAEVNDVRDIVVQLKYQYNPGSHSISKPKESDCEK